MSTIQEVIFHSELILMEQFMKFLFFLDPPVYDVSKKTSAIILLEAY